MISANLVGLSDTWCEHHQNLVSESLVTSLRAKLNTGVALDDALPLLYLTDDQRQEWVPEEIRWSTDDVARPLWVFYDSLSAGDKAQARSDDGLSLSKFDPGTLTAVFQESQKAVRPEDAIRAVSTALEAYPDVGKEARDSSLQMHPELKDLRNLDRSQVDPRKIWADAQQIGDIVFEKLPDLKNIQKLPSDPADISKLVLRIKKNDSHMGLPVADAETGKTRYATNPGGIARYLLLHNYPGRRVHFYHRGERPVPSLLECA